VSGTAASFSLWSNFPLTQTTDGSLPQIVELELTHTYTWRNLTVEPTIRTYFYRDPLSQYSSRSTEGWLYLSYAAGPLSLFMHHSLDVMAYRGAYFVEGGLEFEGQVSPQVEAGGSVGAGWASSAFNDAWVGVHQSGLNRLRAEGWLTAYVQPHLYVGPTFEFSTIVNPAVRAEAARPTFFLLGFTTGVEF
ncbi:MAG: hypothetical protein ACREN5_00985, partial [Gemmatimonadales bacterium]